MWDPRTYANGIYVETNKNIVHLWRWHHGKLTPLPDSSFSEELTTALRYSRWYQEEQRETIFQHCDNIEIENQDFPTEEQVKVCIDIALEAAHFLMEEDIIIGELLYADIMNRINQAEGRGITYHLELIWELVDALIAPVNFHYEMFQILGKSFDYEDLTLWLKECVMKNYILFNRRYHSEFIPKETQLVQRYFFNSFEDYYAFIFLNFAKECRRVQVCEFCGGVFVPKTKRITKYCDRVNPYFGKPCRQVAPKEYMRGRLINNPLLDEYERAKNRNYKRVERLILKNNPEQTGQQSIFEQYESWYQKVSSARKQYLSDKISAQEFRRRIHEID